MPWHLINFEREYVRQIYLYNILFFKILEQSSKLNLAAKNTHQPGCHPGPPEAVVDSIENHLATLMFSV